MNIFLTGGTGFIGSKLAERLAARGWKVTALTRSGKSPAPGITGIKGDVTDKPGLKAAMQAAKPDMVFHNAGMYVLGASAEQAKAMDHINIDGTENVLSLAVELGIPRIIYTSTTNAIGGTNGVGVDETFERKTPTITAYEKSKTDAHAVARRYQAQGAPLVIVCPTQVIGGGDHSPFGWFSKLYVRNLLPPIVWAPDGAVTFVHVDDCAEGMALAAEKGRVGEMYFLGGGWLTIRELPPLWKQAVGGLPPFIFLPRPLAIVQGMLAEPLLRLLGLPAFISREVVETTYVSFRYKSDKAQRELGWQPRTAAQAWIDTMKEEKALIGKK